MTTTTTGGLSHSRPKKRSAINRAGSSLLNSMLRRADIKTVSVERMEAESLTVDQIAVGNSTVETIAIQNLNTTIETGSAFLNVVRTVVSNSVRVMWESEAPFPVGDGSGSFTLAVPIRIPFPAIDVEIPSLSNIVVEVPSAQVSETVISIPPVSNLSFNGGVVTDIAVTDVQLPVDGYGLAGVAFDTFSLSHIGVPDAGIASVSIGSIEPNGNIVLPSMSTELISVADIQVPSIESGAPISVNNVSAESAPIRLIDFRIRLLGVRFQLFVAITATFDMDIGSFNMENMEATSTIDSVSLQDIQFPFKATGIQMTGIGANQLRAEEVSL